jgi:PAS domain S-box-containing protein
MSIVRKTIITVLAATLVLLVILYFVSNYVYKTGFDKIEKQTVEKNVSRVTEALSVKLEALDTICNDWSSWDDTYEFVQAFDQVYIERNFNDDSFSSYDFNIVAIFDLSGDMVAGKAYDLKESKEIPLPDNFKNILFVQGLINPADMQNGAAGIIDFSGQPALIAARQILNSLAEGPATGTLVMARFLDSQVIDNLAATTHLPVTIIPVSDIRDNPVYTDIAMSINAAAPISVQVQDNSTIAGYAYEYDLKNYPVFLYEIEMNREIHAQGVKAVLILHSSLLFLGIVFCVAFFLLMKSIFLNRLTALKDCVDNIASGGDLSQRIPNSGSDELAGVANNINNMLESLEKSEIRRRSQKEVIGYIIDNTPNAIMSINESEHVVMANKSFGQLFGIDENTIIGKKFDALNEPVLIIEETREFLKSSQQRVVKELNYQYQGHVKTLRITFARLTVEKLFFLVITDLTEERVKQERLYLTDRLASVGEMASGIAHELNNPLTSVIGLSEMLSYENLPDNLKEDLAAINSEAKRAAAVVKNMLSFARKHMPLKQNTQVNKLINDVLKLRVHEQRLNNISVIANLDPDLPDISLDFFQIQQVFINIILNAEQAMVAAHGKGTLIITTESEGGIIRITFQDDGPGIVKEHLKRIFDPFFTTKEVGKGTGLGLSISYGIIAAHKGTLIAKSETGKGAAFIIELPIHDNNVEGIQHGY